MEKLIACARPIFRSRFSRRCGVAGIGVTIFIGACAPPASQPASNVVAVSVTSNATDRGAPLPTIPGIPDRPDLVAVVPFLPTRDDMSDEAKTKVMLMAEVDGHRGVFLLDTGAPVAMLNGSYLQLSATGGIDTVAHPPRVPDPDLIANGVISGERVRVGMRIGTLSIEFDDSTVGKMGDAARPSKPYEHPRANAFVVPDLDDKSEYGPELGRISLSVLEQFEAIVDYSHRLVVLIRLDSAGRRLVEVPAYTPRRFGPLVEEPMDPTSDWGTHYWAISVRPDLALDTLDAEKNTDAITFDTGSSVWTVHSLGYPFLRQYGAFGFNQRTRQFIFYR